MGLVGDRPAILGEPLDQRYLPQRSRPVQTVRVEVGRPLAQLGVSAGCPQGDVRHVVTNAEAVVLGPVGPAESARARGREPL